MSTEDLKLRALEQRDQLHDRASELKSKIATTRERLDVNRNVREHFGAATGIMVGVAFLAGYAFAGTIVRH
jgi:hypothetical protein